MAKLKIKRPRSDEVVMLRNGNNIWLISTYENGGICIELCRKGESGNHTPDSNEILIEACDEDVSLVTTSVFLTRATIESGEGFTEAPVAHP